MAPQQSTVTDGDTAGPDAADAADATTRPWLLALRDLVPMPGKYRRFEVDRAGARALLGCRDLVLDALVAAGIPRTGSGDAVLFDYHDLANVALYSGAMTSVPFAGQRMMIRYASAAPRPGSRRATGTSTGSSAAGTRSAPAAGGGSCCRRRRSSAGASSRWSATRSR
ncbi:hypothetical protein NKH77_09625 [Streptomyces sp. M19]